MTDDYTPAEIVRSLKRIEDSMAELRADVRSQSNTYVSRSEFIAWRDGLGRELKDIKDDIDEVKAARAPWWTVAALVISGAALLITVVPQLASAAA